MTTYVLDQPDLLREQLLDTVKSASPEDLREIAAAITRSDRGIVDVLDGEVPIPDRLMPSRKQLLRELDERRAHGVYRDAEEVFEGIRQRARARV